MTHICVSEPTSIGSDNGLSPGQPQAIIWTNAGILLIGPLGTNFSEIVIEIQTFSLRKMRLKMLSAKRQPFCLGLNVLTPRFLLITGLAQDFSNGVTNLALTIHMTITWQITQIPVPELQPKMTPKFDSELKLKNYWNRTKNYSKNLLCHKSTQEVLNDMKIPIEGTFTLSQHG